MRAESASARAVIVRFTARSYTQVRQYLLQDANEQVCFLFAHVVKSPTRRIFLVDHVLTLDPACYLRASRTGAVVDSRTKNAVYVRFAESPYNGFINCHSHPFEYGVVRFSATDDRDDLREMAWQCKELPIGKRSFSQGQEIHALSMVFGQESLDGRGYQPGPPPSLPAIEQVQVWGETLRVFASSGIGNRPPVLSSKQLATYDRQIQAFGLEGQRALSSLRVCLVGCGGIGSVLCEGLARLGVSSLTLIDPDVLDVSNLNRFQGGCVRDVGRLKVDVLADRLGEMVPEVKVSPVAAALTSPEALAALKDCDVLIGAVDNHLARFVLNRLSVQYLIPYLDAATVITRRVPDNRVELLTRLGVVVPGTTACLYCSQITYYDRKALAAHLYDPETRRVLEAGGYVEDHPEMTAPAVMPLNMQAASLALTELLNLVTGFAPLARFMRIDSLCPNGQTLRADSANFPESPAADCLGCTGLLGAGDSEPLPAIEQVALPDSADKL